MTTKTDLTVPQEFESFARYAEQFSNGLKTLVFPDNRGVALVTEASRFAALTRASVDALARPPSKDIPTGSLGELADQIAPAVQVLGELMDGFCRDAAAGVAVLPHQNDLEIGMELLSQSPEQALALAHTIAGRPWAESGHERTVFAECLTDLGVPAEAIDFGGPGTIKILILVIIVLIIRTRPDLSVTLIAVIVVILRIDDAAQGDGKKFPCPKGGGDGGGGDGGDGGNGGGDGKTKCGDTFFVTAIGDDPNPVDSIGNARKNATELARFVCPGICPPRLIFIGRLRTVKQADGTFRTTGRYQFRCT